jgi:hypothetical protein
VPGTPTHETCNGLDDDCNGQVDEGGVCTVVADAGMTCPPPGVLCGSDCVDLSSSAGNCGACGRACDAGQSCGAGACFTPCTPSTEVCDGVDNDCNGAVDDNLGSSSCGTGICARTVLNCVGGHTQPCAPGPAATEACNGLDDDCDGVVDNNVTGVGGACRTGMAGACSTGTQSCTNGQPRCVPDHVPSPELCNGLDDDCNGLVDDGVVVPATSCTTTLPGICSAGALTCSMGALACAQTVRPTPEVCNGLDDNCEGHVDEGGVCGTGGTCVAPAVRCDGNCVTFANDAANCGSCGHPCATGQLCNGGVCVTPCVAATEVCNGRDDDCNGVVDDVAGLGAACTTTQPGRCAMGHTACGPASGSATVACVPNSGPVAETCNGIDDDCNGRVDDVVGLGTTCMTSLLGVCGTGVAVCGTTTLVCQALGLPQPDICNGLDDNCDGIVDNCAMGHACIAIAPGTTECCRPITTALGCLECTLVETCVATSAGTRAMYCCVR